MCEIFRPLQVFVLALLLLFPGGTRPETDQTRAPNPAAVSSEPSVSLPRQPDEAERRKPPVPRRRPAASMIEATSPDEPKIDWLVGQDFEAVQALLGDPALKEVRPPANVWAYNSSGCVLSIYFYPRVGGGAYQVLTYEVRGPEQTHEVENRCFSNLLDEMKKAN